MPLFNYRAVDLEGRMVNGRIDALNFIDLEMRLRRMDLDFIDGKPISNHSLFGSRRIPHGELIHFCFHLENLVRVGVPILDSLSDLCDSTENPRFREVIASLVDNIEGGQTLSQAMEMHPKVFNKVFVSLVRAGEASGRIPEVLRSLTETLKWEDELASRAKKLAIYPVFVGTIVIVATAFLMVYLVPELKPFVKNMGQELPIQTRALFFVSDMLVGYWYVIVAVLFLASVGFLLLFRSNPLFRFRFDEIKLRFPLIGVILRKIILSRFASTFALLYSSGIPVIESIRTTQDVVGNLFFRRGLERVEQLIEEGQNITSAFLRSGFFPPLVIRMLRVGENSGALDEALMNISYFYNRDVKESVEKAQEIIEPLLTLILGALLGWIMLSVLGPVYDVISRIPT